MTASIQNSFSSLRVLERAVRDFKTVDEMSAEEKLAHVEILLDSLRKCLLSLAGQVRFYQSAKGPGRALIITHNDGRQEVLSGQQVEALCLRCPEDSQDAVVYGNRAALNAISAALSELGHSHEGPASVVELAVAFAVAGDPPEAKRQPEYAK